MRRFLAAATYLALTGCGASTSPVLAAHTAITNGCITAVEVLLARRAAGEDVRVSADKLVFQCDALLDTVASLEKRHAE